MADTPQNSVPSTRVIVAIVYVSLFLDNVLLTVVVPIIPDYLFNVETQGEETQKSNRTLGRSYEEAIGDENGRVGLLLSSKAVVQLLVNPAVGYTARFTGYHLPLFVGTVNLLTSSLLFAYGESYMALFFARSLQGVASACIGVSGMSLVAACYSEEGRRSRVMGVVLGSIALGVLLGYPFGGLLYDFVGKPAPFLALAALALLDIAFQLWFLNLKPNREKGGSGTSWRGLVSDGLVMLTAGAIWISSSAMAILEPTLPLWLMTSIRPEKWQLGTVFIPDSLGYLVGTNFFGSLAYRMGRWRVAVAAMLLVGLSSIMVPEARGVGGLVLPHLFLGLGIGVVDAALVPLLATLVDTRHSAHYAAVYALQQMAVSLAYSLGPMVGGELVRGLGFPWLMRSVGFLNLLYCPLLAFLAKEHKQDSGGLASSGQAVDYKATQPAPVMTYKRFFNADDSD